MENIDPKLRKLIFFDGVCHLCNNFVDHILKWDKAHHFQFAPLQGVTAQTFLKEEDRSRLESIIYIENGKVHTQSTAVIKILIHLGWPFSLIRIALILPAPLRDIAYKWVARHRYGLFGKREFCRIPEAHEKDYLLP